VLAHKERLDNLGTPRVFLLSPDVVRSQERLDNLYVAFAVMLRAVVKAGDAITAAVPPAGARPWARGGVSHPRFTPTLHT